MHKLTDGDYLEIINYILRREKLAQDAFVPLVNETQKLSDSGADSLDMMMFYVVMDDVFGIPEEKIEETMPEEEPSVKKIIQFIKKTQTKEFTIEEFHVIALQYK